jgi:ArsR family transcriptional regulator, arsenate/arsenite/antimonite-responsive transcriptional repressor / arsenate reductase (thioredoxin)
MATITVDEAPLPFLQLVADPLRWQLIGELAQSDLRVAELAQRLGKAQNLVSYHLGELRAAGLVSARRSSADGRDSYYRLDLRRMGERFVAAGSAVHPALQLMPRRPAARPVRRSRPRVLFLCTGNSARSQMAAALLEARTGGAVDARSAGSHPKALHPHAVRVMAARGIDIAGRSPTHLDRFARTRFDRVVTLCDKVREVCPEFPGAPVTAHWSMPDPAAAATSDDDDAEFVRAADEIESRVELLIAELALPTEGTKERP